MAAVSFGEREAPPMWCCAAELRCSLLASESLCAGTPVSGPAVTATRAPSQTVLLWAPMHEFWVPVCRSLGLRSRGGWQACWWLACWWLCGFLTGCCGVG